MEPSILLLIRNVRPDAGVGEEILLPPESVGPSFIVGGSMMASKEMIEIFVSPAVDCWSRLPGWLASCVCVCVCLHLQVVVLLGLYTVYLHTVQWHWLSLFRLYNWSPSFAKQHMIPSRVSHIGARWAWPTFMCCLSLSLIYRTLVNTRPSVVLLCAWFHSRLILQVGLLRLIFAC